MKQGVQFFDLLRCLAAMAVIGIHVLAPYRNELGDIPFSQWLTAISVNGMSRWAVPVFILITGALMLSDPKPFNLKYYIKKRLGKVLIPFIVWSLIYSYLAGWSIDGYNSSVSWELLTNSYHHSTYYHLGFFYYFIPLYLIIPMLHFMVKNAEEDILYAITAIWLLTSLLFLFKIQGPWSNQYWLYSGYLLLGYVLYKKVPLNRVNLSIFIFFGTLSLITTVLMVISTSVNAGEYKVGNWLSYKTLNTILVASMIFMLCRYFGESKSGKENRVIHFISQHSLGIYLLHPLFLWPMKEFGWHQGNPAWVIPVWILISGAGALMMSWILSKYTATRWLVP